LARRSYSSAASEHVAVAELPFCIPHVPPPCEARWQAFRQHIGAILAIARAPQQAWARLKALPHDVVHGAFQVDTADPGSGCAVALRSVIQLDGDVITMVDTKWLRSAPPARLEACKAAHVAHLATSGTSLENLRRAAAASWYVIGAAAVMMEGGIAAWRCDLASLATPTAVTLGLIGLRWLGPRLVARGVGWWMHRLTAAKRDQVRRDTNALQDKRNRRDGAAT
jgi:hypothetical protein